MPDNVKIVKDLYDACMRKDEEAIRSLVHSDYTLKDPMMEIHGAEDMISMIKACPNGRIENLEVISEGDKVVGIFDAIGPEPDSTRMRMCNVVKLEGGKVRSEEMFYDTAKIPQEMRESMAKSMPPQKKRA